MKKRKLLTKTALHKVDLDTKLGIPLAKSILQNDICHGISQPSVKNLLDALEAEQYSSLFPVWVDQAGEAVQEQPDNWKYIGKFPTGKWVSIDG